MRLLEDLGVHPIEALQSDALIVVEGHTDVQRLNALLPLDLGRTETFVAGSGAGVETVVRTLNDGEIPIPHLGIRDRDYLDDAAAAALEEAIPNLFVWRSRSIENEILFPPLIAKTLERAGRATTEDEARRLLHDTAERQRDAVLAELVEARLRRAYEYTKAGSDPLGRMKHHLEEVQRVATEKLAEFDKVSEEVRRELDERWDADYLALVDGKRLLSELVEFTPFGSVRDLLAALTQTAYEHAELLPPGFAELRDRLRQILPGAHGAPAPES
jgi:hypothetical protein